MTAGQELGLPENPDVPLLGFIGRLDYQKGVDIIRDSYDWLMAEGCQLVLLGSGAPDLENSLRRARANLDRSGSSVTVVGRPACCPRLTQVVPDPITLK